MRKVTAENVYKCFLEEERKAEKTVIMDPVYVLYIAAIYAVSYTHLTLPTILRV